MKYCMLEGTEVMQSYLIWTAQDVRKHLHRAIMSIMRQMHKMHPIQLLYIIMSAILFSYCQVIDVSLIPSLQVKKAQY